MTLLLLLMMMMTLFKIKCSVKDTINPYNCFFLLTPYAVLVYHFEYVILSILNLHVLVQQFINCYIFSSLKETNWLINKGMCVLLLDAFKNLLLRKTDVLKICQKENLKKCRSFEEQKGTRYIRENVYFGIIIFSCLSSTKPCLRFLLNCFVREIKGFYQSSLGNEVDFRDIMNVSPNILAKN